MGTGPGFIVGEAPGESEARTGKPFQGKSGQLLRTELKTLGLENAYITNTVKCRPPSNRKPEPEEIKTCAHYLQEEIETENPTHILLLGAVATKAVIRRTGITQLNGEIIPHKDGRTYVPAIHPAYVLRDLSQLNAFRVALQRYAGVLRGTFTQTPDINWKLITPQNIPQFRAQWLAAQSASFDVETTGLDWWSPNFQINSIQFRVYPGGTWVLQLSRMSKRPPDLTDPPELLRWCVQNQPRFMVGQNAKFDNNCLQSAYGLRFYLSFDTLLASHLLDENAEHDLKSLARVHLNAPDYDDLTVKEKQGQIDDPQRLFRYGAFDSYYTHGLVPGFTASLKKDPALDFLFHQLVMPAARAFVDIEQNGLFVDLPLRDRMGIQEERALAETEAQLNRLIGRKINWNSPDQVADVLYDQLKLRVTVYTDGGKPSTGESALAELDHPIVARLIEYREHKKFLSTYIGDAATDTGGWRDFMVGPHLYLSTNLSGTVTGRYSSRLHQVPRDGRVRNLITAPRGWVFVVGDFSQVELRFAAHFSKDPELLNCYRQGIDVHWRTMINSLGSGSGRYADLVIGTASKFLDSDGLDFPFALEVLASMGPDAAQAINGEWKEGRKVAKSENFGYVFGMYPKKYIEYAKTKYGFKPTMAEAEAAREAFFNLYPGLVKWHERQRALVRLDGQVSNLYGRIRRLPSINSSDRDARGEAEREGINAPVQGTVGDLKADALVEVHETFPRDRLRVVGEVHDSILMWMRVSYVNELIPQVKRIMERPRLMKKLGIELSVPLVAEFEVGPWGAGTHWRE